VLYHLKHASNELMMIKHIKLTGEILNTVTERIIDSLLVTIQKLKLKVSLDIKAQDRGLEYSQWLDTQTIRKYTTSIHFGDRCTNPTNLIKPIQSLAHFTALKKLEFWAKFQSENDSSFLSHLKDCRMLQELKFRLNFDAKIFTISQGFLKNFKVPESLTSLNFYVSGLTLSWIGEKPTSNFFFFSFNIL